MSMKFAPLLIATITLFGCADGNPTGKAPDAVGEPPITMAPQKQADGSALPEEVQGEYADLAAILSELTGQTPDSVKGVSGRDLIEVRWGLTMGYVTDDQQSLMLNGDLIDIPSNANLSEGARKETRLRAIAKVDDASAILFAPENVEHTVTVFTDVDCGYCRLIQKEMADYHREGIAIRYVAYPRSGPDTESFRKTAAVWCSDDRKDAMERAKTGDPMTSDASDCENPVAAQYALGQEVGLRGTPLMLLEDGQVISGYMPAAALSQELDRLAAERDMTVSAIQ